MDAHLRVPIILSREAEARLSLRYLPPPDVMSVSATSSSEGGGSVSRRSSLDTSASGGSGLSPRRSTMSSIEDEDEDEDEEEECPNRAAAGRGEGPTEAVVWPPFHMQLNLQLQDEELSAAAAADAKSKDSHMGKKGKYETSIPSGGDVDRRRRMMSEIKSAHGYSAVAVGGASRSFLGRMVTRAKSWADLEVAPAPADEMRENSPLRQTMARSFSHRRLSDELVASSSALKAKRSVQKGRAAAHAETKAASSTVEKKSRRFLDEMDDCCRPLSIGKGEEQQEAQQRQRQQQAEEPTSGVGRPGLARRVSEYVSSESSVTPQPAQIQEEGEASSSRGMPRPSRFASGISSLTGPTVATEPSTSQMGAQQQDLPSRIPSASTSNDDIHHTRAASFRGDDGREQRSSSGGSIPTVGSEMPTLARIEASLVALSSRVAMRRQSQPAPPSLAVDLRHQQSQPQAQQRQQQTRTPLRPSAVVSSNTVSSLSNTTFATTEKSSGHRAQDATQEETSQRPQLSAARPPRQVSSRSLAPDEHQKPLGASKEERWSEVSCFSLPSITSALSGRTAGDEYHDVPEHEIHESPRTQKCGSRSSSDLPDMDEPMSSKTPASMPSRDPHYEVPLSDTVEFSGLSTVSTTGPSHSRSNSLETSSLLPAGYPEADTDDDDDDSSIDMEEEMASLADTYGSRACAAAGDSEESAPRLEPIIVAPRFFVTSAVSTLVNSTSVGRNWEEAASSVATESLAPPSINSEQQRRRGASANSIDSAALDSIEAPSHASFSTSSSQRAAIHPNDETSDLAAPSPSTDEEGPARKSSGTFAAAGGDQGGARASSDPYDAAVRLLSAGRPSEAKPFLLAALRARMESLGGRVGHPLVCTVLEKLGDATAEMGQAEEAHVHYCLALRGLKMSVSANESAKDRLYGATKARIYVGLGDLYFESSNFSRALKFYEKSLSLRMRLSSSAGEDDSREAIESARKAVGAHEVLASLAIQRRDYEMFLFHSREICWLSKDLPKETERIATYEHIDLSLSQEDKEIAIVISRLGFLHTKGDDAKGISYRKEISRLLTLGGNHVTPQRILTVLDAVAVFHQSRRELGCALSAYQEKLDLLRHSQKYDAIADTLCQLGCICIKIAMHNNAIDYLSSALRLKSELHGNENDDVRLLHRIVGSSYLAIGNYSCALKHYQDYVKTCKKDQAVDMLYTMGVINGKTEDISEALMCFAKALETELDDPNNDIRYLLIQNMTTMFLSPKKFPKATDIYERALDFADMKAVLINFGLTQLGQRSNPHAKSCLRDLFVHIDAGAVKNLDSVGVLRNMGNMLFRRCRYKEAIDFYERYLHGQGLPSHSHVQDELEVLMNLATAYFKIGAREKSIDISGRTLKELQRSHHQKKGSEDLESYASKLGVIEPNRSGTLVQTQIPFNVDSNLESILLTRHFEAVKLCHEGNIDEAIDAFKDILQSMVASKNGNQLDYIKLYMCISNAYLLKGDVRESRMSMDAAMKLIRKGKVPSNHPVVSQVQRLHKLLWPSVSR